MDSSSGMTVQSILSRLEELGSERTRAMLMRNHGVREPCFGVRIGDMKPLARRIRRDYRLSLDLYATGNYDAQYLAGLVADDERMTRRDLRRWAGGAIGGCLAGTTVPSVAAQGRFGREMGLEWIGSPREHVAVAGWSALAMLVSLKDDGDLDMEELSGLMQRAVRGIGEAPGAVRYAMNQFLISVGCHVKALSGKALALGEELGPIEADLGGNSCKMPYAPDYIRKVERMGRVGRKRRTVKC